MRRFYLVESPTLLGVHQACRMEESMDESAFVQALLDDPSDPTTAMVFADWLEERGDPRGELLRIQTELAAWVPDFARREKLEAREKKLLDRFAVRWLGPLREVCSSWRFRHCFV